jgi:AcrR family transcriptional regulator
MPRESEVRERIIQTAGELFWRNGYGATGVAEILKKAGIGSGSLYWFFKTKEDLLKAVLDGYKERLETEIRKPAFEHSTDPLERIFCVLDVYRRMLLETEFRLGCPVGNIILELGNKYPSIRRKTEELFHLWREMIRRCLVDASERFSPEVDLGSISTFVLTTMEGAVMQARSHRDIAYFDESVANLRMYLGLLTR